MHSPGNALIREDELTRRLNAKDVLSASFRNSFRFENRICFVLIRL